MNLKFYFTFALIITGICNVTNAVSISGTYRGIGPGTLPDGIEIHNLTYIRDNFPNSIIINITFYPEYPIASKDFTYGEHYIVGEKIIAVGLYIQKLNKSVTLNNFKLQFFSPNNELVSEKILVENLTIWGDLYTIPLENKSFIFDTPGLWKFKISLTSNIDNIIWRVIGKNKNENIFQTFKPTEGEKDILESLIYYNFYNEGLPILTTSELIQLTITSYMAQQTSHMDDTVKQLNYTVQALKESTESNADYYQNSSNILLLTAGILIISAIITLIVGLFSAGQQKKTRYSYFKPKISVKINFFAPKLVNLKISNIGAGAAENVQLSGVTRPFKDDFTFKMDYFNPGESYEILLKKHNVKDFFKDYKEIEIQATYNNIFKHNITDNIKIDTTDFKKAIDKTKIFYKDEPLEEIKDELKNINLQLKKFNIKKQKSKEPKK